MTNFKGLQHFPLGNAILEENGENLTVSNMSSCGDGFSVRTTDIDDWEVKITPIELGSGQAISYSLIGKDGYNRLETIGQTSVFVNEEGQTVIAVNSKLMANKIKLTGKLNGQTTFTGIYDNPSCNCDDVHDTHENWIPLVIAAAAVIVAAFDYKKETVRDGAGNIISETTTKSFGGAGSINFQDRDGNEFEADHLFMESTFQFEPAIPSKYGQNPSEIQFMFCNINQITLTDEIY